MIHSRQELSEYLEKRKAPAPHGSTGKYIPRRRKDFSIDGIRQSRAHSAAEGGFTLDCLFRSVLFCVRRRGDIFP